MPAEIIGETRTLGASRAWINAECELAIKLQRHHTSVLCAAESSTRFPWVIHTTFAERFILDGVASTC
jgi:hypothetical protein